jgi:hypothetical protein
MGYHLAAMISNEKTANRNTGDPTVSVIIPAHNESWTIATK